jgi:invasion protein IalB
MATPRLRRMVGRLIAAALAVALVGFAVVAEADTDRLSARSTAAQIVQRYGPNTLASCKERHGYWDYACRVLRSNRTFTVEVRVDEHKIVDRSSN